MPAAYSENLWNINTGSTLVTVLSGLWVKFVNNTTSIGYTSTAVTTNTGQFTILSIPGGEYTVYTSVDGSVYTSFGNSHWNVPIEPADNTTFTGIETFSVAPALSGAGGAPSGFLFQRGNKTIGFGDSTTYGSTDLPNGVLGECYFTYAVLLSGQRIQYARNSGIAGNKTSDMLARVQADVVAYNPARCLILGGINDVANAVPFATTTANLTAIVNALKAAQIEPVLCTLTPSNTSGNHAGIAKLNAWIKGFCTANGLSCIDFYNVLVDPATGNYKAGLGAGDGVHPSIPAGMIAMATEAARLVPGTLPAFRPYLTSATDSLDLTNLVVNGTMQGGGTRATSWVINSGLANTTESIVTGDSSIVGNWQQVAFSGATSYELIQQISTGWSIGDKLAFSGLVSASGFTAGAGRYTARVVATGAAAGYLQPVGVLSGTVTNGVFYMEGIVPSGTTLLTISLVGSPDAGGGTMKFAQMTLINLTTLGL